MGADRNVAKARFGGPSPFLRRCALFTRTGDETSTASAVTSKVSLTAARATARKEIVLK